MLNKIKLLIFHRYNQEIDKCEYIKDVIAVKVGFVILIILSFLVFSLFTYGLYLVHFYDLNFMDFFGLSNSNDYGVKKLIFFHYISLNVVKLFTSILSALFFCSVLLGVPFFCSWVILKITEPIFTKLVSLLYKRLSLEEKERLKL